MGLNTGKIAKKKNKHCFRNHGDILDTNAITINLTN